jgi:NADH:ubiquinone oxidoreductase subunit E
MNAGIPKSTKPILLVLTLVTLTVAIAALVVDWAAEVRNVDELAERLRLAENAAREDPAAAEALQAEVERQTAGSLARGRRQRIAGVIALVAAGICIALLKTSKKPQPSVPRCIADAVTRREKLNLPDVTDKPKESDDVDAPPVDLSPVDTLVEQIGREQRNLIPLLHAVNQHYHYLPPPALARLAESTCISHEQISGVASFYAQFRTRPRGKHMVQVCRGTACHVAGADRILEELRRELRIPAGQDTDPDGTATIEAVGCLGCCTLAPVVDVDQRIEGHVTVQALPEIVDWSRWECGSCCGGVVT